MQKVLTRAGGSVRIHELLVRSPGFSRRGPGLASQRAGRWRARPAKAGTPYQELTNAPAGSPTAMQATTSGGVRIHGVSGSEAGAFGSPGGNGGAKWDRSDGREVPPG